MSPSPSFNSFSNSNLAEIAARVVEEFRVVEDVGVFTGNFDEFDYQKREPGADISGSANKDDGEDDGEFEFASVNRGNPELVSTVSADEIFHNGKILPVYQIFNSSRSTLFDSGSKIVPPLKKLFTEDQRKTFTATPLSDDELDGVRAETSCVWRPKPAEEGRLKRSSFSGSLSKKWNLKNFLQRSFSVGSKESRFLSSPSNRGRKGEEETIKESKTRKEGLVFSSPSNGGRQNVSNNKSPPVASGKSTPPPYNRDSGAKRPSYLPYRQHQVGFFAYMNGLGKKLHPF